MAYTKEWYEKNKKVLAKSRRSRYWTDEAYRASVLEQSRQYREKKRAERKAFLANPYIEIGGKRVPAVTADTMEDDLGITKSRLKYLQKAGYLPPALVVRPAKLYTEQQISMIKELEGFLAENSQFLRSTTDEGAKARADLEVITNRIWTKWEN